ncbi:MAG: carboxypeptidase-like regulatory domain-containing protein [Bacteroidia bacterium]|nr:carboxypeptidase-like regulatory domain-containing protein [Bacteroidia bacterium]
MTRSLYTLILFLLPLSLLTGQNQETERFFQVSGIITDEEKNALPNVGVISIKLRRGTLSEKTGIFSITSTPGDTIFFRALGFKKKLVILPRDFEGRHLNLDITLSLDTIPIENVVVLPWKSYSEFLKDMSTPAPLEPEIENMNKNIASIADAVSNTKGVRITPEAGYRYAMEQNFRMTSTRNQYPVNNLLNPFAWAKFINGLKNGLLKNHQGDKSNKIKPKKQKKKKS